MIVRQTIQNEVRLEGRGLHTGQFCEIILKPAPDHHGIKFLRTDIENSSPLLADANFVDSTNRSTSIKKNDLSVQCTEHLLSALTGKGITDIMVDVKGPEIPILDGSAKPFVEAIQKAGIQPYDSEVDPIIIETPSVFKDEESGAVYHLIPSEKPELTVLIDFNSDTIGQQFATYRQGDDFDNEIAPSKTFVFAHELVKLYKAGLIKGGDLNNAIVIADQRISKEELDQLAKDLDKGDLINIENGILNASDLSFVNEPARHKLLDLIGDLTLVGRPIQARIIADKPGHQGNVALAKYLKKFGIEQRKLKGKPLYDPDVEPVLDTEQVKALLPHRYPFLMVDKIIKISENLVVGVKSITANEQLFQGHFPGNPIFPGVLQMEALAQTGGILALHNLEDPQSWDTYFLKMDAVKFKAKVVPGDTLILKMELLSPIRRGIVHMQGTAYVGNKIVSEGELTAQILKRT